MILPLAAIFQVTVLNLPDISNHSRFWIALIVLCLLMLSTALYYQYGLQELPCVMCIQMRLWVLALLLVAVTGLITREAKTARTGVSVFVLACAAGMAERAYMLLGTERGFVFADCGFTLGLPAWLDLENWFPAMFRIETSCGYTPELLLGITMAEALMALSVGLVLLALYALLASLQKPARH